MKYAPSQAWESSVTGTVVVNSRGTVTYKNKDQNGVTLLRAGSIGCRRLDFEGQRDRRGALAAQLKPRQSDDGNVASSPDKKEQCACAKNASFIGGGYRQA